MLDKSSQFQFLTGRAGTGKTSLIRDEIAKNPSFAILAATTGISAVNLNTTTIHSLLGYYNTPSLIDAFVQGNLQKRLRFIKESYNKIAIDEISMMNSKDLDIIINAIDIVNNNNNNNEDDEYNSETSINLEPLGLILIGDFFQLTPIEGSLAFKAENWYRFKDNITFLTKVWRQDQESFVELLDVARIGKGSLVASKLMDLGVKFHSQIDDKFVGTTIFAKNEQADNYNKIKLLDIKSPTIRSSKEIKGQKLSEWDKIPNIGEFKIGAYVMILNNKKKEESQEFLYCNGDCGIITSYSNDSFFIRLERNQEIVEVERVRREFTTKHKPSMESLCLFDMGDFEVYKNDRGKWVLGYVEYHPLRLAYGITTHKSQGLTLDNIQIDIRNNFFGLDNMLYVALSRARTLEGLRIVGNTTLIEKRCNVSFDVYAWFKGLGI